MNSLKRQQTVAGSLYSVTLYDSSQQVNLLESLTRVVLGRIARTLSLLDSRDPGSDINRLNACGYIHPMTLHPWVYELIERSLQLGTETKGGFDVAAEPSRIGWRFVPHLQARPDQGLPSYRDVQLLGKNRLGFKKPLRIDLSGIEKAFAIDNAIEFLSQAGISGAKIETAGHARSFGVGSHGADQASVTQPAYHANGIHHWRKTHYIPHPGDGRPMRSFTQLEVLADSCLRAKALAKVILFDEPTAWLTTVWKEGAQAVLRTSRGERVCFP